MLCILMDFDLEILKTILISFHQMEYLLENINLSSIKEISKKISQELGINSKKSLKTFVSPYKESKNLVEKESINTLSNIQVGGVNEEVIAKVTIESALLAKDVRDAIYSKYTKCMKKLQEIKVHLKTKESRGWYKSWLFGFLEGATLHNLIIIAGLLFLTWEYARTQEVLWKEPEVTTWCFEFFLQLKNEEGDGYILGKDSLRNRGELIEAYGKTKDYNIWNGAELEDWHLFIKSDFLKNAISIKKNESMIKIVYAFIMLSIPAKFLMVVSRDLGLEISDINLFHQVLRLSDTITKNNYNLLKKYELNLLYNRITYDFQNTEKELLVVKKLITFVNDKHNEWSELTKTPIILPEIKQQIIEFSRKPETMNDLVAKQVIKEIQQFEPLNSVARKAISKVVQDNRNIFMSKLTENVGLNWYNDLDFETQFIIIENIMVEHENNWERVLNNIGINIPRNALIQGGNRKSSKNNSSKKSSQKSSKKKTLKNRFKNRWNKLFKKSKKSKKSIKPKRVTIYTKKSNRFDGSQNLDKDKIAAGVFLPNF